MRTLISHRRGGNNNSNNNNNRRVGAETHMDMTEDNIYFNIRIVNDSRNTQAIIAKFAETRVQNVVDNPSEYELVVVRFKIAGFSIPIFIFEIQDGQVQADPNLGIYSVTLSFGGQNYQTFLEYDPTTTLAVHKLPQAPSQRSSFNFTQDYTNYYFVYMYQNMVRMINLAFARSFDALKSVFPAAPGTEPPYIQYNAETQLFSIILQKAYVQVLPLIPPPPPPDPPEVITVHWNAPLNRFLQAIPNKFNGNGQVSIDQGTPGKDNELYTFNYNNNTFFKQLIGVASPASPEYFQFEDEWNVTQNWQSLNTIVFLSGSLPSRPEYISTVSEDGGQNFLPIVLDFQPFLQLAGDTRSFLSFFPQGPYRMSDVLRSNAIRRIQLSIFWSDRTGRLFPLELNPSDFADIKLLFTKSRVRQY